MIVSYRAAASPLSVIMLVLNPDLEFSTLTLRPAPRQMRPRLTLFLPLRFVIYYQQFSSVMSSYKRGLFWKDFEHILHVQK